MTKEQMVAEFGATGVQNPMIMDLITLDEASDHVVLVMIERRAWGASPRQFLEIEEKINRYLGYVVDGFLEQQYPQYRGKRVRIRLDCVEAPQGEAAAFVSAAQQASRAHGIDFVANVAAA
jgi:hypothetical protein